MAVVTEYLLSRATSVTVPSARSRMYIRLFMVFSVVKFLPQYTAFVFAAFRATPSTSMYRSVRSSCVFSFTLHKNRPVRTLLITPLPLNQKGSSSNTL